MRDMVGRSNVVQFLNIFETDKFIIIQMEHLKGSNMKRDLNNKIAEMQQIMANKNKNDSFYNRAKGNGSQNLNSQEPNTISDTSMIFKFGDPKKFW